MRGVVRAAFVALFSLSASLFVLAGANAAQNAPADQGQAAQPAPAAAAPAPTARVIITPDADYSGFDLETLKGVTLDGCKAACTDNQSCRAFTFNAKAGWCFLKSDFGTLTATPGATAGRIVATPELTPSLEKQRLGELDFLASTFIDEARELAGAVKRKYPPDNGSYQALRDAGGTAYRAGSYKSAIDQFGQALAVADDNPGLWLDFAIANLAYNPDSYSDKQEAASNTTAAAIAAYIRSDDDANRAQALAIMGSGFERRELWRQAYRAYRASLKIAENADVRSKYEKVLAEHGFRILSNTVDADSANPRICIVFSDKLAVTRADLADYVTVEGGDNLAIEPSDTQICIDGIKHGSRYQVRVRGGLPSADGETLDHPAEINVYVRDRAPWVGFAGNDYVLPAGKGASIPIVSVNTDKAKATVYRIGDRGLAGEIRSGDNFRRQLDRYAADTINDNTGEKVWEGDVIIQPTLNENVTTAIPIADMVKDLKAGVYVITAKAAVKANSNNDDEDDYGALATQWFIVTDLGLTTLSGHDGLHAIVRSLSTAEAVPGVKLRLVAANDDILGEAVSDADGHVRFDPGLARGTGGMTPQIVDARTDGDYAFLDLSDPAFDLSDRGVDGRAAPAPLDVFLTPERGIYRPGETMHLTALVRDARANAVTALPMTMVIERPDGVEFARATLSDQGQGGYSYDATLDGNAMRGSWTVKVYADPKGDALAQTSLLVEDFQPERLAFDLTTAATALSPAEPATIDLAARYLYGAPAPDLSVDGDVDLKPVTTLSAFPGYSFGLADETVEAAREPFDTEASTDDDGKTTFDVALPELPKTTKPIEATVIVRLTDTNGRAIERNLKLPVKPVTDEIGIKPLFDGDEVAENSVARFEVIAVGAEGTRVAAPGLKWKLERVNTDYQWYKSGSNWNYELVTTTQRVDTGTVDASADGAVTVSAKVDWGSYRLTVESEGDTPAATSVNFYAGYYSSKSTSETPDVLRVSLDKPAYKIGETAKLRLDPRFAGIALITVIDDRLIAMKAVEVPADGTTVDLDVTDQWGPGAYVAAALYRPMDVEAKRMPTRALGLAWAKVDPGNRDLNVSIDMPDEMRPRGPMAIPVSVSNLAAGEQAYITVAAVDLGILNLTNFKPPAPDDWYYGQRKLGMEIRDVYGLLIDRMQGVPGTVRSGGDSGAVRLAAPPPTEKLVAFYSGVVKADASGKATVSFDIPDFNGTVRVMVMAWTKSGVGHATKDVIVRDPVVVTASLPQFLNRDDKSRLLVEINNVAGGAGDYRLTIEAGSGIGMADSDKERVVTLAEKQRLAFNVPITGASIGDYSVKVSLMLPNGESFPKTLALGIRPPGEPVTRRNLIAVNANGGKLTVDDGPLAEFVPGTASATISLGGASTLDVAGILASLDRYPYGCVEQLTSRALPLVYLDDVAVTVGLGADKAVRERVQQAIVKVLADQDASGSFGLWGPYDTGDLWLDSYVTDFLTRAAEKGYDVPKLARDLALDNLANRISYSQDFSNGGQDIAYGLYVLARAGRAAIGDLRYYVENKLDNFATALAKAQLGAALSLYGDRPRAAMAFNAALAGLNGSDNMQWRSDYGTLLRDQAAVLTLAAETRTDTVDIRSLATKIAASEAAKKYTSTQEDAWMLLAAAALIKDSRRYDFTVDGSPVPGPLFKRYTGEQLASAPVVIENRSDEGLDAVVSATGVPTVPDPAGGNGFKIERAYYTPTGDDVDIKTMAQNDRVVVVLTVTGDTNREGHLLIVDPIPAGYEIENPDISSSGDTNAYDWLSAERSVKHTEARVDRYVAAVDRNDGDPLEFSVAYTMRAVSPGTFAQPAATVSDMYRPDLNARTDTGTVEVVGATR